MRAAVQIDNVGKCYRLVHQTKGGYKTLRDSLSSFTRSSVAKVLRRHSDRAEEEFWALKDLSFNVDPGEVVGIIGRNGAGKSTLLKIISRITKPTCGRVTLNGRVGSLLEVGTGFHPELTGRENVYLNGSILGMSRREITKEFDAIVTFAEIEKFLDTPVKRYSSGMYVRLAFAVAAHLRPEILIVDEVLAVGDLAFQKKCLGKMQDIASHGRTVLFVTHNMAAVSRLCTRGILLEQGGLLFQGRAEDAVAEYMRVGSNGDRPHFSPARQSSESTVALIRARVLTGHEVDAQSPTERGVMVEMVYTVHKPIQDLRVGFQLVTSDGTIAFTASDVDQLEGSADMECRPCGTFLSRCTIPEHFLPPGHYTINVGSDSGLTKLNFFYENAIQFVIADVGVENPLRHNNRKGIVCPTFAWQIEEINRSDVCNLQAENYDSCPV